MFFALFAARSAQDAEFDARVRAYLWRVELRVYRRWLYRLLAKWRARSVKE